VKVERLIPILNVSNIQESFAWFEKLGWKYLRTANQSQAKALTQFPDVTPQLQGIKKQLVTYKRANTNLLTFAWVDIVCGPPSRFQYLHWTFSVS